MSLSPNRVIAFMRNGAVKPVIVQVRMSPVPSATPGKSVLEAANVTSFTVTNPNPFHVWYKGWAGVSGDMTTPFQDGNFIGPMATVTQTSSRPDFITAMPVDTLGAPIYGSDNTTLLYDMSKAYLVFVFGSGL